MARVLALAAVCVALVAFGLALFGEGLTGSASAFQAQPGLVYKGRSIRAQVAELARDLADEDRRLKELDERLARLTRVFGSRSGVSASDPGARASLQRLVSNVVAGNWDAYRRRGRLQPGPSRIRPTTRPKPPRTARVSPTAKPKVRALAAPEPRTRPQSQPYAQPKVQPKAPLKPEPKIQPKTQPKTVVAKPAQPDPHGSLRRYFDRKLRGEVKVSPDQVNAVVDLLIAERQKILEIWKNTEDDQGQKNQRVGKLRDQINQQVAAILQDEEHKRFLDWRAGRLSRKRNLGGHR